MTTSSTSTFEASRDDLIAMALENVGAIGPGETRNDNNSYAFDSAARALNAVVKSIDKTGQRLWRFVRRTTTTTAADADFTPAADVLDIDEPVSYLPASGTARTTLTPISRDEYMRLPDRTTAGTPRNFYVEKTLTGTTVYWWPVPDTTGDTIEYTVQLRGLDFTSGSETPDFPAKWTNALVYGLTVELAPKFNQLPMIPIFQAKYEAELRELINEDGERGNITFNAFANYRCGAG